MKMSNFTKKLNDEETKEYIKKRFPDHKEEKKDWFEDHVIIDCDFLKTKKEKDEFKNRILKKLKEEFTKGE